MRKLKQLFLTAILSAIIQPINVSSATTKNKVDIRILMPAPFADSTAKIIDRFNRHHKNQIEVTVTRGPLETESVSDLAISSLLLGDNPYDILLIDVTWLPKYAEAGWLFNMDKMIDNSEWELLIKGARLGNKYKGTLYRWPLVADIGLLYWRKDLMKIPPTTPNELFNISKRLQKENKVKYGYVWQGKQYEGLSCVFLEVLSAFGGEWITENGEVKLNSPNSLKATRWLQSLIKSGISPKAITSFAESEALQSFKAGQSAFMRNWPYAWSELQKDSSAVKGNVGVTVMVSDPKYSSTSTLGSWGFSILNRSANKNESMQVISYLTSESSQKLLFKEFGYTPTRKKLFSDPILLKQNPILTNLKKGLEITKPRPQIPLYAQVSDILQRELSTVLTQKHDIKDSMNRATYKTRRILNSYGID